MPNYVPGVGNSNAKILIVGEAPGADEDKEGEPFKGSAGNLLNEILRYANIDRRECYITNVCKVRPPQNDLKKLNLIGYNIKDFLPQLWTEINEINPNVIFGLGDIALYYLTGNKGILAYRGSILRCAETGHKVVCSIHPAAILHGESGSSGSYTDLFLIKQDAVRVAEQQNFPEIIKPERQITLINSSTQLEQFLERNTSNPPNKIIDNQSKYPNKYRMVTDVETFKTYPICIGIAFSSTEAASIAPFDENIPETDLVYIWEILHDLYSNPNIYHINQNTKFDYKRCRQVGLLWKTHIWFDTMQAYHCLFPELRKDLGTISSLLTEEPYYKSEGKEYDWKKHDFSRLRKYNAKDCYTTYECYERLHEMLIEERMEDYYFECIRPLNELYSRIEDFGIKVDLKRRDLLSKLYKERIEEKYKQVLGILNLVLDNTVTEYNVNSSKQVGEMLYGHLKLPFRKNVEEDTLKALMNNATKDPIKKKIIALTLELRKLTKAKSTYIDFELAEI